MRLVHLLAFTASHGEPEYTPGSEALGTRGQGRSGDRRRNSYCKSRFAQCGSTGLEYSCMVGQV
jgi:hypothetical protein